MSDEELRIRARRLLTGNIHLEDLDRLFLDQRERCHGRKHFREIGDFLAHRSLRNKGPVTAVIQDIMTSFRVWSMPMRGEAHKLEDICEAGEANLRLMTDTQIRAGCGMRRRAAETKFRKGFAKLKRGSPLTESEVSAIQYLGNQFVWRPVFTDDDLLSDFVDVLTLNGLFVDPPPMLLERLKTILALHALSRMHETFISDKGLEAQLYAGASNKHGVLEVKLNMNRLDWPKPVVAPLCIFMTSLLAKDFCDSSLPFLPSVIAWDSWSYPIELTADAKLCRLI
jgi:hypothetical protein